MKNREDRCAFKRCRGTPAINYLGHRICDAHWTQFAEKTEEEFREAVGPRKDETR